MPEPLLPTPTEGDYPCLAAPVHSTAEGTAYLTEPGVHLLARPAVNTEALQPFLDGFAPDLGFGDYPDDPETLSGGAQVSKVAGQLCYASFGPRRTWNRDADRYFRNILASGHGSVLEHPCYTFLLYGISRSVTHELIRHRAGFGYSQLSQRYVSGRVLRFVERPEFADDPGLHALFEARIDRAALEYARLADLLAQRQGQGASIMSAEARTDLRKKVQQSARALLPNETEAPMVATGNARAWRHFVEMRANAHAETEIRALAVRVYACLAAAEPLLFGDYRAAALEDGTVALETEYRKV